MPLTNYFLTTLFTCFFFSSLFGFQENGLASWYADEFHNRKTASGELYNKNKLTAAHRTLPFGTKVKVTRIDNGKSVIVTINDRGPHIGGRIIDLSRKAAEKIDLISEGVTMVKIVSLNNNEPTVGTKSRELAENSNRKGLPSIVEEEIKEMEIAAKQKAELPEGTTNLGSPTSSLKEVNGQNFKDFDTYQISIKKPSQPGFGIQVASLKDYRNVLRQIAELQEKWNEKILLRIESNAADGNFLYKLIIGPYDSREEASRIKEHLKVKDKVEGFIVNISGN